MNKELAEEMLRNIALAGDTTTKVKAIIGGNLSHILTTSSGSPRLQTNVINRFKLILSQPSELAIFNPFEMRCALCKKVVNYPCWYYSVKYAVNHFHYFVCFDSASSDKPNCKCYRRD